MFCIDWPTERRQLSHACWGSLIPIHVGVPPHCVHVVFSSFCNPRRIFRSQNDNPAVENTSEMLTLQNCLLGISDISRYRARSLVNLSFISTGMFFTGQQSVVSFLASCWGSLIPAPFMFVCHREAGCTWVEDSDCMAVVYMRCVAAELCGRSCCMLLQSCAVCCAFLPGQNVPQYETKTPRSLLPNNIMIHNTATGINRVLVIPVMRCASAKRETF